MIKKSFSDLSWKKKYIYESSIVFEESELKNKGSKFQIIRLPPKTTLKPHYHKRLSEIYYIKEGTAKIKVNDDEIIAIKDDIILISPNDIHGINNYSDKELVILIFKTNEIDNDLYWTD